MIRYPIDRDTTHAIFASDPEVSPAVFSDGNDFIIRKSVSLFEVHPIESAESFVCTDPQIPPGILIDKAHDR
jgi:hypothetical protein